MITNSQLVRLPVTARQKFDEAVYFYNQMVALGTNIVVFPYYLSGIPIGVTQRYVVPAEAIHQQW